MTARLFLLLMAALVAALSYRAALAQECDTNCSVSERDESGCCPAAPKSTKQVAPKPAASSSAPSSSAKAAGPAGWGGAAAGAGCATGLIAEGGRCCWPGQGSDGSRCIGTPTCPSALVASGSTCVEKPCPEGKVKASGQCCWPGQAWSTSGSACVGTPTCPKGQIAYGTHCGYPDRAFPGETAELCPLKDLQFKEGSVVFSRTIYFPVTMGMGEGLCLQTFLPVIAPLTDVWMLDGCELAHTMGLALTDGSRCDGITTDPGARFVPK